eukprot:8245247-Pyramimonas_sp.AAC.1
MVFHSQAEAAREGGVAFLVPWPQALPDETRLVGRPHPLVHGRVTALEMAHPFNGAVFRIRNVHNYALS